MMTLNENDVIATGTPSGVSKMQSGDVCEVEIEGIGTLRNSVR
jgi:2-keto-4-pentenoate hydratase/2-oxohepta-3-ene-1,7-dioic acid hydratase in catechol pathway